MALHDNLYRIVSDFGSESVTKGSHLEKLCLIRERVGQDNISDFTTNLIKGYLCGYTQEFARRNLSREKRRVVSVPKVRFNYDTETWESDRFELPWTGGDYVLLTPRDVLAKDDTWINRTDLIRDFERLPDAIPNGELRAQVNNYFLKEAHRRIAFLKDVIENKGGHRLFYVSDDAIRQARGIARIDPKTLRCDHLDGRDGPAAARGPALRVLGQEGNVLLVQRVRDRLHALAVRVLPEDPADHLGLARLALVAR